MECTAHRHMHGNHLQGNVYGSSLKIIRIANAWQVHGGYDLESDREGARWAFQDAKDLCEFIAAWCAGELPQEPK